MESIYERIPSNTLKLPIVQFRVLRFAGWVKIKFWRTELTLTHAWAIASGKSIGGIKQAPVAMLELTSADGITGLGEASPGSRYNEYVDGCLEFFAKLDASKLSFDDIPGSMAYLESISPGFFAAKGAVNIALVDGSARKAGKALYDHLGLGFRDRHHVTSFSIGIAEPEVIRGKVLEAAQYPVLKLKMGRENDRENLAALREAAPDKWVRVDANEGWKTREQALERIEWLATDGHIQFIEQPMPSNSNPSDLQWLKERSPLPIFGDESFHSSKDVSLCRDCFHGVNAKLCKTGGVSEAFEALKAARAAGLKTMICCMIESSILISAAAHLAELVDYLDIDGNILINNDPYLGVSSTGGLLSFQNTPEKTGLRVSKR